MYSQLLRLVLGVGGRHRGAVERGGIVGTLTVFLNSIDEVVANIKTFSSCQVLWWFET